LLLPGTGRQWRPASCGRARIAPLLQVEDAASFGRFGALQELQLRCALATGAVDGGGLPVGLLRLELAGASLELGALARRCRGLQELVLARCTLAPGEGEGEDGGGPAPSWRLRSLRLAGCASAPAAGLGALLAASAPSLTSLGLLDLPAGPLRPAPCWVQQPCTGSGGGGEGCEGQQQLGLQALGLPGLPALRNLVALQLDVLPLLRAGGDVAARALAAAVRRLPGLERLELHCQRGRRLLRELVLPLGALAGGRGLREVALVGWPVLEPGAEAGLRRALPTCRLARRGGGA
jgi:hypothetical protein